MLEPRNRQYHRENLYLPQEVIPLALVNLERNLLNSPDMDAVKRGHGAESIGQRAWCMVHRAWRKGVCLFIKFSETIEIEKVFDLYGCVWHGET